MLRSEVMLHLVVACIGRKLYMRVDSDHLVLCVLILVGMFRLVSGML